MYVLHIVLHTFPLVLKKRICLTIKNSEFGDHFLQLVFNSKVLSCKEKLDASPSQGYKVKSKSVPQTATQSSIVFNSTLTKG